MGFLSDKFEARKHEKLEQEMRKRAIIVTEAFKNIYAEATKETNVEGNEAKLQSITKASVEKFLIRSFREASEQEIDIPVLKLSEETVRDFVWYVNSSLSFDGGINAGNLVAWAQNMNETAHAGRLVTMPGATVESSRGYRGLLHANAICKKMGWDWGSMEKSEREYADHVLALVVGDLMAFIFDTHGLDSEVGFAGQFSSALLNLWNVSKEREELQD